MAASANFDPPITSLWIKLEAKQVLYKHGILQISLKLNQQLKNYNIEYFELHIFGI